MSGMDLNKLEVGERWQWTQSPYIVEITSLMPLAGKVIQSNNPSWKIGNNAYLKGYHLSGWKLLKAQEKPNEQI